MLKDNIQRTLEIESEAIKNLGNKLDYNVVDEVVNLILNTKGKIIVSGAGTSGVAAKKIVHTLSCISIPAVYLTPSDAIHGSMGIVKNNDIVILISKGGNTQEITNLLTSIKELGAIVVGVGENMNSKIGKNSDIFLKVETEKEPDIFNMMATASTISVIACFDAIIIEVMRKNNFTKKQFSINHPGGAVGERLSEDTK